MAKIETVPGKPIRGRLARLADHLILQPSQEPIDAAHKTRMTIAFGGGDLEVWTESHPAPCADHDSDHAELFVLKFPGTGGRAERGTLHPADVWDDLHTEVWTVNPPGYGGSSGEATLHVLADMAETVFQRLRELAGARPIVVTGNSLGNIAALHLAANCQVDALLLRNPPPLRELIVGKHGWWTLGMARFIARQVPSKLCSISNAAASECPALFIMSGRDRMVPPRYQRMIIDAHAGENRLFVLPDADHADPVSESEVDQYIESLAWLRQTLAPRRPSS